jgi:hypothetical protein
MSLGIGVSACVAAIVLLWLHLTIGPPAQRVNIRFAPAISTIDRLSLEQRFGLTAGIEGEKRTWSYRLRDRSRANLEALLSSPSIEDSAHIDLSTFRVRLNRTDVPPWLRALIETDWLPAISPLLALLGLIAIWRSRRDAVGVFRFLTADGPHRVSTALGFDRAQRPSFRELAIGVGWGLLFLAPLLIYGPIDDEEGGLGIFSSQIQYRELLLHGRWVYWLNDLGFGTPLPLGHSQALNPVFALGSLVSLRFALSLVWLLHIVLMVVYFLRLAAVSGVGPLVRSVLLISYVFSAASVLLFYRTDWLSCVVAWTLYPMLVYYLRETIVDVSPTTFWMMSMRLGLIAGVWVMNSHPGYLVALTIPLGMYVLVAAPRQGRVYGALVVAAVVALMMSAERVYFTLSEFSRFPTNLARFTESGFAPSEYLAAAVAPVVPVATNMRLPFLGAVMLCAAAVSVWRIRRVRDRHTRGCIVAFVAAIVLSLLPIEVAKWTGVSGGWLFRDPMIFFGSLCAGVALQAGLDGERRWRSVIGLLLVVQLVQQVAAVSIGFTDYYASRDRLQFYRYQGRPHGLGKAMLDYASQFGKRIYFSEDARVLSRGFLSDAGVHFLTDLVFLGLNPLNGWFKNISMDHLSPSYWSMHGSISGQRDVIENAALLDVLGINLVVTTSSEHVATSGLLRLGTVQANTERGTIDIESYANPDAWPVATMLSTDVRHLELPLVAGCGHTGALCRRYDELVKKRLPDRVSLAGANGEYLVRVPPSTADRLLFVSVLHRPEFTATSSAGSALRIDPIAGAFLGVTVPPGVQEIRIVFEPRTRIVLAWLSVVSTATFVVICSVAAWRRRLTRTARDTHLAGSL